MKKILAYYVILFLLPYLIGCSKDESINNYDSQTSGEFWEKTSGTYRGKMYVDVDKVELDTIYQHAIISSDDRNRMTLSINSIIIDNDMKLNNIFFKNIYMENSGSKIILRGTTNQFLGNIDNVKIELEGELVGENLELNIQAKSVAIRTVNIKFIASKLSTKLNNKAFIEEIKLNHPDIIGVPDITYNGNDFSIICYVRDTLKLTDSTEIFVKPAFKLSNGARITYPDSLMNFAGKDVKYTVWAEDSIHRNVYKVKILKAMIREYTFNRWVNDNGWEEPVGDWATNNGAIKPLIDAGSYSGEYPVTRVKGLKVGEWAANMKTVMTGEGENKRIFAGSFFMGEFDMEMKAPNNGPLYGILFKGAPSSVRGYYKYLPSDKIYIKDSLRVDTIRQTDTCGIRAILYEVVNPTDVLDSLNYLKDPKVVAVADIGRLGGYYRPTYTPFSIYFRYLKMYSPVKRYKIALICTSSKKGYQFIGAPGSELSVGAIEVRYSNDWEYLYR